MITIKVLSNTTHKNSSLNPIYTHKKGFFLSRACSCDASRVKAGPSLPNCYFDGRLSRTGGGLEEPPAGHRGGSPTTPIWRPVLGSGWEFSRDATSRPWRNKSGLESRYRADGWTIWKPGCVIMIVMAVGRFGRVSWRCLWFGKGPVIIFYKICNIFSYSPYNTLFSFIRTIYYVIIK